MVADKSKTVKPTKEPKAATSKAKSQKAAGIESAKGMMISIKQIGSPIRRDPRQAVYLKSLGLGKMNKIRQVVDTPATRGLLSKLQHMVVVVEQ